MLTPCIEVGNWASSPICEFGLRYFIMEPADPMDVIPPSEVAPSQVGEGDQQDVLDADVAGGVRLGHQGGQPNQVQGQGPMVPGSLPVIGNVMLTPAGIRSILGRKIRPKPLLRLVCKGCQVTTHDTDPLVPGDFVERLGLSAVLLISHARKRVLKS